MKSESVELCNESVVRLSVMYQKEGKMHRKYGLILPFKYSDQSKERDRRGSLRYHSPAKVNK